MGNSVGIVGASCNGVSMLGNILHKTSSDVDSITLIDPRPPGGGPTFNPESSLLLCNTSAGTGSLIPQEPNDFLHYLASRGQPTEADAFVARDRVGEYVRARYQEYVDLAAAAGVKVNYHPHRVTAVRRRKDGSYEVRLNDGASQTFSRVVICVGLGAPKLADGFPRQTAHPRVVNSPFPVTHMGQRVAGRGRRVLVLGTGQSAVDAAVSLCHDGHQVTMASRSGILPAVRSRFVPPPAALPSLARIPDLDPADPLLSQKLNRIVVEAVRGIAPVPLRHQLSFATDPIRRLREEIELGAAGQCGWHDITFAMVQQLNAWTSGMPPAAWATLLPSHRPLAWRYLASMAVENAKRLLRYSDAGQLRVGAYDPANVTAYREGFNVEIRSHGRERFDYAVNAVGFLFPNLYVDDQNVYLSEPPPTATALEHLREDLRVRLRRNSPPEHIWLVGQATHISTFISHFFPTVAFQASNVASQLAAI